MWDIMRTLFGSSLKLALRRRSLSRLFSTYYFDLLNAIQNDNYEAIEAVCEKKLCEEIAAKMYEWQKDKNVQFRVINEEKPQVDVQVINHFFISNMSIDRDLNPSLRDFKISQKSKNWISYVQKGQEGDDDFLDSKTLDILEELKHFYQMKGSDDSSQPLPMNQDRIVQDNDMQQIDIRDIEERRKFENSSFVQKEALKAFKEIKKQEYRLLTMYKSKALTLNIDAYFNEVQEKEKEHKVTLDPSLMAKDKVEYLETVSKDFHRNITLKETPQVLTFDMYLQKEQDNSDLYKFIKIFCPTLYNKYVRKQKDTEMKKEDLEQMKKANIALSGLQSGAGQGNKRRRVTRLFRWIKRWLMSSKVNTNQQLIEVYDVLIKTKMRLQLFHLKTGTDVLLNPQFSDYLYKIDEKFNQQKSIQGEGDSVYVLEVDKSIYDIKNPSYTQTHCLRFEVDRTKSKGKSGVKITDIDFYLEGNRHAVAQSDEFYKQSQQ